MADRVRPANSNGTGATHAFPPTKSQTYARPAYRPRPPPPKRRGCCCSCCLWLTFLLIALVFLAAIAGAIFYFVYRPHRPSFSVSSLRLSSFNVSASNSLSSRFDLNVTARNPNKKLVYVYDPITITISASTTIPVGEGSLRGFTHEAGNTTLLRAKVVSSGSELEPSEAADLRKAKHLELEVQLESKAGVKVGSVKTKKVAVRVRCTGVKVAVPTSKKAATVAKVDDGGASCEVKLRVKIWKWYLF